MNSVLVRNVLEELFRCGIREFCVCPGGRNVPLVSALSVIPELKTFYFVDERAAAFFALGRIRAGERPVAVITTSGTAAGELLPAVMEAHYSGMPLVVITADRPRSYRGTGAPQTAEQVNLYGQYVEECIDRASNEVLTLRRWSRRRPIHLNLCFDEPLLDDASSVKLELSTVTSAENQEHDYSSMHEKLLSFLQAVRYPLVLVGGLAPREMTAVQRLLCKLRAPVYAEAPSGLRETVALEPFRLNIGDRLLTRLRESGWNVDGIVRIGSVPTHRIWRDLEVTERSIPVLSLSSLPFSGMTRSKLIHAPLEHLLRDFRSGCTYDAALIEKCVAAEVPRRLQLKQLCIDEPESEQAIFRALSSRIPPGSRIFIGNSLPIRHWDAAATFEDRQLIPIATRGLNGIDGQISTFLGSCNPGGSNWGIFGDLTALYDLNAPWILRELMTLCAQIIIINNSGGRIFERMFPSLPQCLNEHDYSFEAIARMWNLAYEVWNVVPPEIRFSSDRLIEVRPDAQATRRFTHAYEAIV